MSKHLQLHQFRRTPHPRFRRFTSHHQPKFPPLRLPYLLPSWKQGRFHLRSNHVTPHVLYLQYTIIRTCIQSPHPMHFPSQSHKTESLFSFTNHSEFYLNLLGFHYFDMWTYKFNNRVIRNRLAWDYLKRSNTHICLRLSLGQTCVFDLGIIGHEER